MNTTLAITRKLYTASQIRQLDQALARARGVPTWQLMQDAATAAYSVLKANWPEAKRIIIMTGSGNNAGDGWLLAALLCAAGVTARVIAVKQPDKLCGDASLAADAALQAGCEWRLWASTADGSEQDLRDGDLLVDALLGTGITGELRDDYETAVNSINHSGTPVLALDLPTGLNADTGAIQGACVKANITVTFVAWKRGQMTLDGPDYCGLLSLADLGLSNYPELLQQVITDTTVDYLGIADLHQQLPVRNCNSHKKSYGHVIVIAGNRGMAGAGLLAATAALRSGAGLVTLLTHADHVHGLHSGCPELMLVGIDADAQLPTTLLTRADCIVIGPGMGQDSWAERIWSGLEQFLSARNTDQVLPLVVDADGLSYLTNDHLPGCQLVLTPHPGEAARLLQTSTSSIQQDRFASALELAECYNACVILKGNGTIISGKTQQPALSTYGNPGMATAGMGDVLAGVCGGLLAQKTGDVHTMTCIAVVVHGLAGDHAAKHGQYSLIAGDVINALSDVLP